jgi:hypothetical protein
MCRRIWTNLVHTLNNILLLYKVQVYNYHQANFYPISGTGGFQIGNLEPVHLHPLYLIHKRGPIQGILFFNLKDKLLFRGTFHRNVL